MAKLQPRDHTMSLAMAATYIKRHRATAAKGPVRDGDHGHAFHADQVIKLLQQPGCTGLRIYQGVDDNGHRAPVLVGVDGDGKDMTAGTMLQTGFPCPPWCDDDSALKA